ncbi:hypothetical protein BJ741DRAFT_222589 [Chytriomyces cf. hyalinus JEL632]|nr:hypothetical protein BJ741DRAFT_222589 [Chytriomyces cf. hyalinus JEL632]
MELPAAFGTRKSKMYLWLILPELYQSAFASKYLANTEEIEAPAAGPFPASILQLTHLKSVYLARSNFTGRLPDGIGALTNLASLFLDSNRFQGTIPISFNNLVALQALSLLIGYNPIYSPIPKELWSLVNLVKLEMCQCGLTGSLAGVGALSHLEELDACHNDGGIPPNEPPQISRLKSLHLIGNPRLQGQLWDFQRMNSVHG